MKIFLVLLFPFVLTEARADVLPGQPQDLVFEASQEHAWWEFPVQAEFSQEAISGSLLRVDGFWDGEKNWVVRTAFPSSGRWTWRTVSTDSAMNGLTGTLQVGAANSGQIASNPNLRGSLQIAADNRHFEYADGTPLFLLASTLWAGNTARCGLGDYQEGPFFQHLADRKAKGFNTILMQYFHGYGDYPDSAGHRNEDGKPYLNIETKDLNPPFFQYLDQRMQALWEQGFIAAIPVTWWGKTNNCVFTPLDA